MPYWVKKLLQFPCARKQPAGGSWVFLTTEIAQLVFVDTPGIHQAQHKLGKFLNQEAEESLNGVDLILWLVDGSSEPDNEDKMIASSVGWLETKYRCRNWSEQGSDFNQNSTSNH